MSVNNKTKKHITGRKTITLENKLKVINLYKTGSKATEIARTMNLHRTTIQTILKNANKICDSCKAGTVESLTRITTVRSLTMGKMENLLSIWIEDLNNKNIPVSTKIIQEKALSLFNDIRNKDCELNANESFTASRGWFARFKARSKLHNIKLSGEAASADTEAAGAFPATLEKIISQGGYSPQQVCYYNLQVLKYFTANVSLRCLT